MSSSFLRIRFDGGRFVDHTAPVEVLAEFATLERLLLATARQLFLDENPTRSRMPKGFVQACRLVVVSTEHNCFTTNLDTNHSNPQPEIDQYVAQARELVFDWFGDGSAGPIPAANEPSAKWLSRFGAFLKDDEVVTLKGSSSDREVSIDYQTRMRLARRTGQQLRVERELDGEVFAVDIDSKSFKVRTDLGAIELDIPPKRRDDVLRALAERPLVVARFSGLFNFTTKRAEQLHELDFEDHPRSDEVRKVRKRIDSFSELVSGWLSPTEGSPTSPAAMENASDLVGRLLVSDHRVPRPGVFPTPDGGVSIECYLPDRSACIIVTDKSVEVSVVSIHDEENSDAQPALFYVSGNDDFQPIANFVRKALGLGDPNGGE